MAMTLKAGTALKFGAPEVSVGINQSGTTTAGGDLRVYKDHNGNDISIYLNDDHTEATFDALLEASATMKKIGDEFSIGDVSGRITAWTINWSNEEVARVSGTIRTYDIG